MHGTQLGQWAKNRTRHFTDRPELEILLVHEAMFRITGKVIIHQWGFSSQPPDSSHKKAEGSLVGRNVKGKNLSLLRRAIWPPSTNFCSYNYPPVPFLKVCPRAVC